MIQKIWYPACVNCNLSHKYEKSLWYCCNRSQCKCEICCSIKIVFFIYNNFIINYLVIQTNLKELIHFNIMILECIKKIQSPLFPFIGFFII